MNKTEKNKVTMYYAVNAVLANHQASIDSFAPLADAVTSFRKYLNEIMERAQESAGTVGATASKNNALDDMTERTYHISNALYTFGRRTNNEEIKGVSKLSLSDIYHLRENELVQYCARILTLAQTNAEALAPYTITAEMITTLGQTIDTYRHHADSKDTRFAGSKAAREVLFNLFANADELLREDIDTMVELLKNNNNDFYNQYNAARTIKDIGGSPKVKAKAAEAIVIDETRVPSTAQ
ncbi:MAG: hypothetical protein ACM31E_11375 [Fibrobacterota bacterium]|nr:hypothetical protein [Chitinispirillaceae bacterium]